MAMLAGPRKRNRFNLTPRGKALYDDDTRFGTQLLLKMGWTKGNGLGANESGDKDFVRVRYKNCAKGLGYEDRNDQWTQHEDSFNGLLKTLNSGDSDGDGSRNSAFEASTKNDEEEVPRIGFGFVPSEEPKQTKKQKLKEKISGESLEEKSKRSKARVHYKKFTRGKDLAQYSEKDLANIFGKKAVEEQQANGIYEQFTAITVKQEESADEAEKGEQKSGEFFISNMSTNDYFKQKMEEMKNKRNTATMVKVDQKAQEETQDEPQQQEENVNIAKNKKKKRQFENDEEIMTEMPKNKKKKKHTKVEHLKEVVENSAEPEVSKNHKKSKKNKGLEVVEHVEETTTKNKAVIIAEEFTKKKKNKKNKQVESAANECILPTEESIKTPVEELNKKKKNKVKKQQEAASTEDIPSASKATILKSNDVSVHTDIPLDNLIEQLNAHNVYTISSFCAEKFRNFDVKQFAGSSLSQIVGYSFSEQLELNIKNIKSDEDRITHLWSGKMDKYTGTEPRYAFNKYKTKLFSAHKTKKKLPKFRVKNWKRKQIFQAI